MFASSSEKIAKALKLEMECGNPDPMTAVHTDVYISLVR